MTSRRNLFLIAGALILMGSGLVMAQAALSTIRGTVTDQSGAIVPGVQVTITEVTTNITARTIVTDDNGNFEAPDLKPGTYRLTAELPGFKNYVADNILLESAQIRRIDPVLEIGEATQEVMVEAGAAVITTEGGSITSGIESETYKDVPLVDIYPGPLSMLSTLPGVQGTGWVVAIGGQSNDQITQANDGVVNDRSGQGDRRQQYGRSVPSSQLQCHFKKRQQLFSWRDLLQTCEFSAQFPGILSAGEASVLIPRVAGGSLRTYF